MFESEFFEVSFVGIFPNNWAPSPGQSFQAQRASQATTVIPPLSSLASTPSEEAFDATPAWRQTIPSDREGLMRRLFVLEPQYRYLELSQEDHYCENAAAQQEQKQWWAAIVQLGLDNFPSTFEPAGSVLNPEETSKMTPDEYQRRVDNVLNSALAPYVSTLSAIWANSNQKLNLMRWPLSGLTYEEGKPATKGKKRASLTTVTPPSKRVTRSSSSPSFAIAAQSTPIHPVPPATPVAATPVVATPVATPKQTPAQPQDSDIPLSTLLSREEAAQAQVVEAFGRAVDSGVKPLVGAHIIAKATKLNKAKRKLLIDILNGFLSLKDTDELESLLAESPNANIFPLSPNAHAMWDRLLIALRPIKEWDEREDVLYVQIDLKLGLDVATLQKVPSSFLNGYSLHHSYPVPGESCKAFPLCHGAVFKIRALNLDKHPLPSYRLLQWQYHLHHFAAVFKAGGKVDTLYKGPKPPPDGPTVPSSVATASEEQEELLKVALEQNILTPLDADLWRAAYIRHAQALQDEVERTTNFFHDLFNPGDEALAQEELMDMEEDIKEHMEEDIRSTDSGVGQI